MCRPKASLRLRRPRLTTLEDLYTNTAEAAEELAFHSGNGQSSEPVSQAIANPAPSRPDVREVSGYPYLSGKYEPE